jgi:urease accessory protein UreE
MLIGLGATVEDIEAPFDPEGGAYGGRMPVTTIPRNDHMTTTP